jgi:23S rRNA (adenine2503-C2)-methyltransferase
MGLHSLSVIVQEPELGMISIYDQTGLEALRKRTAIQPHRLKTFRNAFYKKARGKDAALGTLPEEARDIFRDNVRFTSLELTEQHESDVDGATKLGFRTSDGHMVESVILRVKSGRIALCISSQIGCACNCTFCATGQLGFLRDLTYAEILDQVAQANRLLRKENGKVRNVVFMGMGEPFLNLENLFQALELLTSPAGFAFTPTRVMVSTVGIPDGMSRCAERFPDVRQALSLHSARQRVRETLIPLAKRYDLDMLRDAIVTAGANGKVMIEYLMLEGINDQAADLEALVRYLQDAPVHINIIPYNTFEGCAWRGTPQPLREAFAEQLKRAGFQVTQRYSLGLDITAACGQLARTRQGRA